MLKSKINKLKDIGADFLLDTYCQPYAEGVESAWHAFNSIVDTQDAELKILRKLVQSYSNKDKAPNSAEDLFQKGIIDFYEYVLNYKEPEKEKEELQKEIESLKEKVNHYEKFIKELETHYSAVVKMFSF